MTDHRLEATGQPGRPLPPDAALQARPADGVDALQRATRQHQDVEMAGAQTPVDDVLTDAVGHELRALDRPAPP